jgi:hypothetical protein
MEGSQNRWARVKLPCWIFVLVFGVLMVHQLGHGYTGPGLKLELAVDSGHAALTYSLGTEPVKLFVSISNTEAQPIATARGFSQIELYDALIVTDPSGVQHLYSAASSDHKMPPPFFISGKPWALAEELPADWVRSVTINDLTEKFPVMKTTAGWYTIEARTSFIRFAPTDQNAGLGFIGLLGHPNNWTGTVAAQKLQIYIAPARGAKLKVQVLAAKASDWNPVAQVPVKVFKSSGQSSYNPNCDLNQDGTVNQGDLQAFAPLFGTVAAPGSPGDTNKDGDIDGSDLAAMVAAYGSSGTSLQSLWEGTVPVLAGTTDFEGWSVWQTGLGCLREDGYLVVAFHSGVYDQSSITAGDASGWGSSCEPSIVRKIQFGGQPPAAQGDFNADGCIDLKDFNTLMAVINSPAPRDPIYDLNADGAVNIADARYLALLFSNPNGAPCN